MSKEKHIQEKTKKVNFEGVCQNGCASSLIHDFWKHVWDLFKKISFWDMLVWFTAQGGLCLTAQEHLHETLISAKYPHFWRRKCPKLTSKKFSLECSYPVGTEFLKSCLTLQLPGSLFDPISLLPIAGTSLSLFVSLCFEVFFCYPHI